MATQITAYLSDDGQIFRSKDDADFSDYMGAVAFSVKDFIAELDSKNPPTFAELLLDWEIWRIGGREGWDAMRPASQPPLAEPAPPVPPAVPVRAPAPVNAPPARQLALAMDEAKTRELAKPAVKTVAAYRKHIAIVGLRSSYHTSIEREFGDVLKLTIYDADCVNRLKGLRACHKVILMTRFVSHKHRETLKSIGQDPLELHGTSVTELKEALTNIYVNS